MISDSGDRSSLSSRMVTQARFSIQVDDLSGNQYPAVTELARISLGQQIVTSILVLVAWLKLFDFLSAFSALYRLIIIIEMVSLDPWKSGLCND